MIGRDGKQDIMAYGWLPWIVGVLLAAGLIALMFGLADSIS